MLDSEVDSVRSFVRLWAVLAIVVLVYAWIDLRLHPQLLYETNFSLKPNLNQVPELLHWGGRLLKHGALSLLIGNALVLSGVAALLLHALIRLVRRLRNTHPDHHVSIVPGSVPTSVPPQQLRDS